MSTTNSDLEEVWRQISAPRPGQLNGRLLTPPEEPSEGWAALDSERCRHLLVNVPPGTEPLVEQTRGMQVSTEELQIGADPTALFIDLRCSDPTLNSTFSAVVIDVLQALQGGLTDARQGVVACLERWKWFWRAEQGELSQREALGLFGELWFLSRWLTPVTAERLRHWTGPTRFRHDFQWREVSVEVKCTSIRSESRPTHRVTHLSQLEDPERGRLLLYSLHVTRDDLALNTLPRLVAHLTSELEQSSTDALRIFREKLAEAGYNPALSARYGTSYRILSEGLYEVADDFPRLTAGSFSGGLPAGVGDVSYILDMAACEAWKRASNPAEFDLSIVD